jgi:GNAT superfamily N-acetyltransferase
MKDFEIIMLNDPADLEFANIKILFRKMYNNMEEHGLMLDLAENGPDKWAGSVRNMLGKFAALPVARSEGRTIGFAHGALRFTTDYLGSRLVGVVTHIYVEPDYRNSGAGKALVESLEGWFTSKKVHSVELQVITGNVEAMNFWERLGYSRELVQFRKII